LNNWTLQPPYRVLVRTTGKEKKLNFPTTDLARFKTLNPQCYFMSTDGDVIKTRERDDDDTEEAREVTRFYNEVKPQAALSSRRGSLGATVEIIPTGSTGVVVDFRPPLVTVESVSWSGFTCSRSRIEVDVGDVKVLKYKGVEGKGDDVLVPVDTTGWTFGNRSAGQREEAIEGQTATRTLTKQPEGGGHSLTRGRWTLSYPQLQPTQAQLPLHQQAFLALKPPQSPASERLVENSEPSSSVSSSSQGRKKRRKIDIDYKMAGEGKKE